MNKIEQATLKGVRNTLNEVRTHSTGDDWESYGRRLKERIKAVIPILDELLKLETYNDTNNSNENLTL